jgi:AbrB family looped-hinge helix DNA binding protein
MIYTIQIDGSGRLVLPKAMRERLNLAPGSSLRAEVVAGHIELTPTAGAEGVVLTRKGGVTVLKRTGIEVDAAAAVAGEREALEERALRR